MAKKKQESEDDRLTEPRPDIPTLLIDGYHGLSVTNHVVRINLTENVFPSDPVSGTGRRVVARLAMGIPAMLSVYAALGDSIEQMQRDGVIEIEPVEDGEE